MFNMAQVRREGENAKAAPNRKRKSSRRTSKLRSAKCQESVKESEVGDFSLIIKTSKYSQEEPSNAKTLGPDGDD